MTDQQKLVEAAEAWLRDKLEPGQMYLIETYMDELDDFADHTHAVADILHREVLRLREQLRWIPVAERLPRLDRGRVQVLTSHGDIFTSKWLGECWGIAAPITHWRPLDLPEGGAA